ncbi:MAG TPA: hypothetical protein VE974_03275 [Thermoanaerobaculia bacterium]|nr:hypothetical protein [Thermoanaerobaculia bacterium]
MRRKPDLIVPIHDRRKRRRILTLKNFAIAMIVFFVIFAGISIRSELRGTNADYGRLMQRELPPPVAPDKPVEVVTEAAPQPVPEATHADPLLLAPMAREQWLHGDPNAPVAATAAVMPRAEVSVATGETRVAIVGGTEGVTVVKRERRQPVLAGGFGRR